MKLKHLIMLPLVTVLASCNTTSGDSSASKVKQELPDVFAPVEKSSEDYQGLISTALNHLVDFNAEAAFYRVNVSMNNNISTTYRGKTSKQKIQLEGDFSLGYFEDEDHFASVYFAVDGLKSNLDMDIMQYNTATEEMVIKNYKLSSEHLSLAAYIQEDSDKTMLYLDVSDAEAQAFLVPVISMNMGVEEATAELMLDYLLGSRAKDSETQEFIPNSRPGLAALNISTVLTATNTYLPEGTVIPGAMVANPISCALTMLPTYFENMVEPYLEELAAALPGLGASVGTTYEQDVISTKKMADGSIGVVLNSSVKNVATAMGASKEELSEMPSGNFGLFFAVGSESGSEYYALEAIQLAAELKMSQTFGEGAEKTTMKGTYSEEISMVALYNGLAIDYVKTLSDTEMAEYNDITEFVSPMLAPILAGYISQYLPTSDPTTK